VASDSRALTLKLLADTADFQKKLSAGSKDIDSIGERAAEFGKKAALAFAVAGAAIGAFAVSAVKAAAEDEAAQRKLAETIRNTTAATDAQIAGVEAYITKTSIAIGVTDDQLRPAFSRLVRSTNDVEDAQKLLNLALDLSAATGKPLEAVTNALGRAYDGNTTALGKLGLGIDQADLKGKTFDETFQDLTATFGNFAENESETTAKQMERVKIALDEAKESIGAALLPVVQELTDFLLVYFIPTLEAFIYGLTGQGQLDDALTDSQKTAIEWGKKINGIINTVVDLKDELLILAGVIATVFVVSKVAAAVAGTIALINGLIKAYNLLKASSIVAGVAAAFALNPLLGGAALAGAAVVLAGANALARSGDTPEASGVSDAAINAGISASSSGSGLKIATGRTASNTGVSAGLKTASGTGVGGTTPTLIEQVSEANFIKRIAGTGSFDVAGVRRADERGNVIINVNSPSVIDEEGFSRAVILALNSSQRRNGGGLGGLQP
jgi:hypothetical protein